MKIRHRFGTSSMKDQTSQPFIDDAFEQLSTSRFSELVRRFSFPVIIHCQDCSLEIRRSDDLVRALKLVRKELFEANYFCLHPVVIDMASGELHRFQLSTVWRLVGNNDARKSRVDFFVDAAGTYPKIAMVDIHAKLSNSLTDSFGTLRFRDVS